MVVDLGEAHVGGRIHVERRGDVDQRKPAHALRVVERQPVRNAPAPIVADQAEARVAQFRHQRDHVERHRTLAVVRVIGIAGRLR